jgi:hemerythrin
MALIEWKDSFSVGIADVDYEHREMIDLINGMHERLTTGPDKLAVNDALGEIFQAISAHFALEERFMREHRYDQLAEHKGSHEQLLDEIRVIMDGYEANPEEASKELSKRLERWFIDHCKTHDSRLHQMLGNHDHH